MPCPCLRVWLRVFARTQRVAATVRPQQGTKFDRIDYNIEQAADRVGNAVVELNKANEYQKKSRTMLCIYLLLLLCGFMVIVLILKKTALGA